MKLTTEIRGKFKYTFCHDNDFVINDFVNVPPGPYHQNRLLLANNNGIISPFFMGEYSEFLLTKEWKRTRDNVIDVLGPKCWSCKSKKAIHVHHVTYQFGWLPYPFDMHCPKGYVTPTLIPICKICHLKEHLH